MSGEEMMQAMHKSGIHGLLQPTEQVYQPDTVMPVPADVDYCPYPQQLACDTQHNLIRTIDGSCNNLDQPLIGRSMTPFRRLLPAKYADGMLFKIIIATYPSSCSVTTLAW